jgi:hypothetical protein
MNPVEAAVSAASLHATRMPPQRFVQLLQNDIATQTADAICAAHETGDLRIAQISRKVLAHTAGREKTDHQSVIDA